MRVKMRSSRHPLTLRKTCSPRSSASYGINCRICYHPKGVTPSQKTGEVRSSVATWPRTEITWMVSLRWFCRKQPFMSLYKFISMRFSDFLHEVINQIFLGKKLQISNQISQKCSFCEVFSQRPTWRAACTAARTCDSGRTWAPQARCSQMMGLVH